MIRIRSRFAYLIYMMRYKKPIFIEISSKRHTKHRGFIDFSAIKPTFICAVKTLLISQVLTAYVLPIERKSFEMAY